jgi:glycosidase
MTCALPPENPFQSDPDFQSDPVKYDADMLMQWLEFGVREFNVDSQTNVVLHLPEHLEKAIKAENAPIGSLIVDYIPGDVIVLDIWHEPGKCFRRRMLHQ